MVGRAVVRLPVFAKLGELKFRVVMLDVDLKTWAKAEMELCCRYEGRFVRNSYWSAGGDLWASSFDGVALRWDGKALSAGNNRPIEAILNSGVAQAPSPLHGLAMDLHKHLGGEEKAPANFFLDGNVDERAKDLALRAAPDIANRFCLVDDRLMMRSFGPAFVATRRPRSKRDACYALREGPGGFVRGGETGVFDALDDLDHVEMFHERLTDFWGDEAQLEVVRPWRDGTERYLAMTAERLLWSFLECVEKRGLHEDTVLGLVLDVRGALESRWPSLQVDGRSETMSLGTAEHLFGTELPDPLPLLPLVRRIVHEAKGLGLSRELPAWDLALDWMERKVAGRDLLGDLEGFAL